MRIRNTVRYKSLSSSTVCHLRTSRVFLKIFLRFYAGEFLFITLSYLKSVLRIRSRIRILIHRIRMFLGFPDPDPIVRGTDPDPIVRGTDPDPSIIKQK